MNVGEIHHGLYWSNKLIIELDSGKHFVTAETDDYIALFRPGRSVYESLVGSTYQPARVFFCRILERIDEPNVDLKTLKFEVLLESPIRRS